jgi:AcrR family transcriptional regulator
MASRKRDRLIKVASDIFFRQGFHATGVDAVIKKSRVAPMTLYKQFKSKENLILAALEREDQQLREGLVAEVERRAKTPVGRLLAIFDVFGEKFRTSGFYGCAFMKASCEYPSLEHPIHKLAITHKARIQSFMRELAVEAGARDAETLSQQLFLLLEGALAKAQVSGQAEAANEARAAAEVLARNAIPNA